MNGGMTVILMPLWEVYQAWRERPAGFQKSSVEYDEDDDYDGSDDDESE